MRFPRRAAQRERLALSWSGSSLAYVLAQPQGDGRMRVRRLGVERQGDDSDEAFAKRLAGLGFKGLRANAVLLSSQYQVLQIDAPAVPPEELRTAVRWQIRELVDAHMDDLTLDVLRVGDDKVRATGSLFVVVSRNDLIREVMAIGQAMRCAVNVIDVQDLAQRNLQTAYMEQAGRGQRAHAALVPGTGDQALLTISANGELFYTRRIDLGAGFLHGGWEADESQAQGEVALALAPAAGSETDRRQRLVVEVQRSLDLWDRTWPTLPVDQLGVYAGAQSAAMAEWLADELGQSVSMLDVGGLFPGFEQGDDEVQLACWPLLGELLRSEGGRT